MKRFSKAIIVASAIVFFLLIHVPSFAQIQKPIKVWDTRYGGDSRDTDVKTIRTSDGGFLITSSSLSGISGNKSTPNQGDDDWWVVKTDQNGNFIWDFNFGGIAEEGFEAGAVQTADGNYVLAGRTRSGISGDITSNHLGGSDDILIVKIDATDRSILWQTRIGGNLTDWAFDLTVTSDGNVVVGGYTTSTDLVGISPMGSLDLYLVKVNSTDGAKVWERTYGGSGFESADELLPNDNGGVVVGAYSASTDLSVASNGSFDFWIFSTDANGNVIWENLLGGAGVDAIRSMTQTSDGGYVFSGQSNSNASGNKSEDSKGLDDVWTIKTDASGNLLWEKTLGGSAYEWGQAAYGLSDGSVVIGGFSNSPASGDKLSENIDASLDVWFFKLDESGALNWQADFGSNGSDGEVNIPFFDETTQEIYLSGGTTSDLGSYISHPNFGASGTVDVWFTKFRIHELPAQVLACAGTEADVNIDNAISSSFSNKRYELRNSDGVPNGIVSPGEEPVTTITSSEVLSDTTLYVYAISDLPDGSILEEFIGPVSIAPGDELLESAKLNLLEYDNIVCFNKKAKVKVLSSVEGVTYELINEDGDVLDSKLGTGENLVLKSPKLKVDTNLSIKLINTENGCSELHPESIFIQVEDKITAKISFDRSNAKVGEPITFSSIDDDGIVSWTWTFDKKTTRSGEVVNHTFNRPGIHWIELEVENSNGCKKVIQKKFLLKRKVFFGVPGVFWPCTNQGPFKAKLKHVKRVKLTIINKNGRVVYSGSNSWHGVDRKGKFVRAGQYFYKVNAVTIDGKKFQKKGSFYITY